MLAAQSGSAPLAVALRALGAPSSLQTALRVQDVSTVDELEALSNHELKGFGLTPLMQRHLVLCARRPDACENVATPGMRGRRLAECVDMRQPGMCAIKKRRGRCAGKGVWGCDKTCGMCDAASNAGGASKADNETDDEDAPDAGSTSQTKYDGNDDGNVTTIIGDVSTSSGIVLSACVDRREASKCEAKKMNGECNTWGCDKTCGKCSALEHANAEMKVVGTRSRRSIWWVYQVTRAGGYATVVVPTLCKRVNRLSILVDRLSQMSCIGEVMIVSRPPCINEVKQLLATHVERMKRIQVQSAPVSVIDMGGWDQLYGPATRFFAAIRARQGILVHLDDDEMPCEQQVCRLAKQALLEPVGLYGHHKRICTSVGYTAPASPSDLRRFHKAPFNVLLTLFAATSRFVNDAFVRYFGSYAEPLASTRGNGEDIAYNHFLLRHFNRTPTYVQKAHCGQLIINGTDVYKGGFSKLNDAVGISANQHHYRLRRRMCRFLWRMPDWGSVGRLGPQQYPSLTLNNAGCSMGDAVRCRMENASVDSGGERSAL